VNPARFVAGKIALGGAITAMMFCDQLRSGFDDGLNRRSRVGGLRHWPATSGSL